MHLHVITCFSIEDSATAALVSNTQSRQIPLYFLDCITLMLTVPINRESIFDRRFFLNVDCRLMPFNSWWHFGMQLFAGKEM